MNKEELSKVLENHLLWLSHNKKGSRANFYGADLRNVDLVGANLRGAGLYSSNLEGADLRNVDLLGAILRRANLRGANLEGANLHSASFGLADLQGANLRGANLHSANLQGANLQDADLQGANLEGANLHCANLKDRKVIYNDIIRHYILYGLSDVKDGPRFIAGCRNFTYKEAIYHWSQPESEQPEYVRAIEDYMKGTRQ